MSETIYIIAFAIFFFLGVAFGIMSIISAFWYAKDGFTPTRKSVLISGKYMIFAMMSCVCPSSYFLFEPVWAEGINLNLSNVRGLLFGTVIFFGFAFLPVLTWVGISYLYALSREEKNS